MSNLPYEKRDTILTLEGIHLTLGGNVILRGVNAKIRDIVRPGMTQGQVDAILGPSGIGKTQLFRIISGLIAATQGRVLINASQTPVRRGEVGVVAQSYPLFMHRTALGNMLVAATQKYPHKKEALQKSMELIELFDLGEHIDKYPAQLSGGQRQRLAIAQQLICSDHFLLMDEPFSGLDPIMLDKVGALITKVSQLDELNTIIVVTHDVEAAVAIADTLWLVGRDRDADGKIVPGAYIKREIDLIERNVAWHPEITRTPEFSAVVREIRDEFQYL